MKYTSEFRSEAKASRAALCLEKAADTNRAYKFMEFCGGHTHAIHRYGIMDLLPKNIEMIHGPGCPVCVLPISRIDYAIALCQMPNTIFCSYGDMLRVPGTRQQTLLAAKARGADIRMVYSVDDALSIAQKNPDKEVVFFAIGFETTTPATAMAIINAEKMRLDNFSIFCNHVLTPVAMQALLTKDIKVEGFVGPAHVSIIIGSNAYKSLADQYKKPIVISGFEPLDIMHSILMLVDMVNNCESGVKNQYTRAVNLDGNLKAQQAISQVFEICENFEWRGLGVISQSAMRLRKAYASFDAETRFPLTMKAALEHKACECAAILCGIKKPPQCKLFGKACTPESPLGACMVSSEGACAAYYLYKPRIRNELKN